MTSTVSKIAIYSIAVLHAGFMIGELYPWRTRLIMRPVVQQWTPPLALSGDEERFASMVVHNAGIYNGIVGTGLFVAARVGPAAFPIQIALLTGGIVAGLFGFATLTPAVILQAILAQSRSSSSGFECRCRCSESLSRPFSKPPVQADSKRGAASSPAGAAAVKTRRIGSGRGDGTRPAEMRPMSP